MSTPRSGERLVVRADEVVTDPEGMEAVEASYRRAVQQTLAFAVEVAESSGSLHQAIRRLAAAEALAADLRHHRKDQGGEEYFLGLVFGSAMKCNEVYVKADDESPEAASRVPQHPRIVRVA
jgi:hypothetical protein